MSLYDAEGVEAYMLLGPKSDPEERLKRAAYYDIWLKVSGLACHSVTTTEYGAVFAATEHPPLKLFRLNVQGYADEGTGEVKSIYQARILDETNVVHAMHYAAFELAEMALNNLRIARKEPGLTFVGSCARAREVKESWLRGEADGRALRELKKACDADADRMKWNRAGRRTTYRDPISYAIGHVSELAAACLELDAGRMLSDIVMSFHNIVAVKFSVEKLLGSNVATGWDLIEGRGGGKLKLNWDTEPILRKHLLPANRSARLRRAKR